MIIVIVIRRRMSVAARLSLAPDSVREGERRPRASRIGQVVGVSRYMKAKRKSPKHKYRIEREREREG